MVELKNRSLERGIILMEVLASSGACALADLHRQSGLPKSTIRRLLGTLISRNIVRRSVADQKYRININLPASIREAIPPESALVADVAMPILSTLTRQVGWPSDLHLIDGKKMRIVDSTRPLSPFQLYQSKINRKLNIFGSATGIACLAAMNDTEITKQDSATKGDKIWGLTRFLLSFQEFLKAVEATRTRGYGFRLATSLGETPLEDGLSAIAVPIQRNNQPVGAINLLFPRHYLGHEKFADQHLAALKNAATQITTNLKQF